MWYLEKNSELMGKESGTPEFVKAETDWEKALNDYQVYFNENIKERISKDFIKSFYEYNEFSDWDLLKLEFNHEKRAQTNILLYLFHPFERKNIIVEYSNITTFNLGFQNDYFLKDCFSPGMIGFNEFHLNKEEDELLHKIYFWSNDYICIGFKSIAIKNDTGDVSLSPDEKP